jgi:methyl-accepting chemotaxis protein
MSSQAEQLQQTMSFFKLDGSGRTSAPVARKSTASTKPAGGKPKGFKAAGTTALANNSDVDETKFTKF